MATVKAPFGRGVPLVNLDQCAPIPPSFVLQLAHQFTPTHVANGFGQAMVFDHVLDLQTLDANRLVLTDQLCRELVLIVAPSVTDTSMYSGNLTTGFVSVLGTFFLLGKTALSLCQLLLILLKELGIAGGLPIGGDDHGLQAQVKPDLLLDF